MGASSDPAGQDNWSISSVEENMERQDLLKMARDMGYQLALEEEQGLEKVAAPPVIEALLRTPEMIPEFLRGSLTSAKAVPGRVVRSIERPALQSVEQYGPQQLIGPRRPNIPRGVRVQPVEPYGPQQLIGP